ncbi:MAG: hypothetical protein MUF19_02655 [Candidatus Pacebacteria bacterium]|jgi:hypothetical protein|nr:hypothetical protein [Candidatus Paceibacterota bacterium]
MLSISSSIILGVVSGITTSLFVWVIVKIFNAVILPWYQTVTYQGSDISGTWICIYTKSQNPSTIDDPDQSISIEQHGHTIAGSIFLNKQPNGDRNTKEFKFRGIFRDGHLVFTYEPKDKTKLGLGTHVLRLINDGQKLEGSSLYISADNNQLSKADISWIRRRG